MREKKHFALAALIVLFGAQLTFAAHTPVFTWQVRGDANYRQGIYDGDDRIAFLDTSTLDEPMQALMFFSLVEKPLLLREVKLAPGGKPLVEAIHLFWKSGKVITTVLDGLAVEGNGTDRLTVTFTVRDPYDVMKVARTLTVTYDAALDSYVYDFRDLATVNSPETLGKNGPVSFEYCDPWLCSSPAPSQRFSGMWKGRYAKFAYESKDGAIAAVPHNHFSSSLKSGILLKKDGVFAATYEPDGCPAIQLLDDTSEKTRMSICPWGYDIHMGLAADGSALYAPLTTHFRFFRLPDAQAKKMHEAAIVPRLKPGEFDGAAELPMFERVSGFEKSVRISEPHQGDIDPWFWVPQNEKGAVWDRASGRTAAGSLKIEKATPGVATWYSMCEGQGYFTEPWTPCKGYEISVWVKTNDAAGAGASLGACYHVPNIPPAWAVSASERVAGTKDWTKLTLRLGAPPEKTSIMSIHLQLAGKGTCWFDDLEVKMLK